MTRGNNAIIVTKDHNHAPDPDNINCAIVSDNIKTLSRQRTDAPRAIVNECLAGVSNNTIAQLPQIVALEHKVSRARKQANQNFSVPHTLAEIILPDEICLTRTHHPENFVLADTGANDEQRIIVFCSRTDYLRLSNCSTWLADATFKVAPEMFSELWVIHGLYFGRAVPLVFCLLPNKLEETYSRALGLIFESIDLTAPECPRPNVVIIDFEKAEENAFRTLLPNVIVHGCFFHFC